MSSVPHLLGGVAVATVGSALLLHYLRRAYGAGAAEGAAPLVVVVPGGGLTAEGTPPPWVRRRLEEAAAIYLERRRAGQPCIVVTLSGGTPHKPMPIDPRSGYQVFEAEGNARHLVRQLGVDAGDVVEENWSLDTIGNAFMLRVAHADVAGWKRLLVVNNAFHMPRTRAIFEKVFALTPQPPFGRYELDFVEVPDEGLEGSALSARKEREAKSLEAFRRTSAGMTSLKQMHSFLFGEHMAYASRRLLEDRKPVDPEVLKSY